MTVNYSLTEIFKAVSVSRLILRLPTVEDSNAPSEIQRDVVLIEGSPEGVEIGSPGDLRLQIDEPAQLWIKSTGERTTTGWVLIGSGGGGTTVCNLVPAPIVSGAAGSPGVLSTAARCDHEHPAPDIPAPSDADPEPPGVAAPGVSSLYARGDHVHPEQVIPPGPTPSDADPEPLGVAAPGVSLEYSRADHVHPESAPPATPPLDQVLVAGNTTGGTDVQFSNGDELQLSDGAINRGILDYLTNTIRLRTFTAAGALAGTLTADAAASPFLTWTGPGLYVNNAQPALYLGNNGGQVFVLLRKAAGSVNSILFQAANITRTEITQLATSQDLIIAQRNGAGAETSRITYENATGRTTFPGTVRAGNGAIAYPSDAGLNGQVITSAGDGTSSWQTIATPSVPDQTTVYEIDFASLGNQDFADGPVVVGDRTWQCINRAAATIFGITAGVGLRITSLVGPSPQWNGTARTSALISIALSTLLPGPSNQYTMFGRYGFEIHITENTAAAASQKLILGLVMDPAVQPFTAQNAIGAVQGFPASTDGMGIQVATTAAVAVPAYSFSNGYNVMRVMTSPQNPSSAVVAAGIYGASWPTPGSMRESGWVSSTGAPAALNNGQRFIDPATLLQISLPFNSVAGFNATIRRLRVVRLFG